MSGHVFVDESKRRGYLLNASVVVPPTWSRPARCRAGSYRGGSGPDLLRC